MPSETAKPHHPLPKDRRARHDRLPESIEDVRDLGDDDPEAEAASADTPPAEIYRDPDGRPYPS
ncbi:hypothetical protein [Flavisphingomonas formosensis]|uniref:hypothetical protein n=1 Tax=Flavisphingomonas formosensis TaxID=861534 RepID=UPI0012FC2565|nr:hypothetical protein [Sphingomonas formosensis]